MMKKVVLYVLIGIPLISCKKKEEDPVFPIEPYIEFRSIQFVDSPDPSESDSLKISFYFRDGDFDLGLSPSDSSAPYNREFYFLRSNGSPIADTQFRSGEFKTADLLTFKDSRQLQPDTLPVFAPPYSCTNWELMLNTFFQITDTLYYRSNQDFFNIYVNILISNPDGSTSLFDFSQRFAYPNCYTQGYNGRFAAPMTLTSIHSPSPFKVAMLSSREGIMTYSMASTGWKNVFSGEKIKVNVKIRDRALHPSNEIESSEVQF